MFQFLALLSLFTLVEAVPQATSYSNCVGTISSLSDVGAATQCSTVNINAFTVPAGETFSLNLLQGTTVNVLGDIQFGNKSWAGPLFEIEGQDITFNGNGKLWDGGGPFYWDGLGTASGEVKPHPMMKIVMSGTLSDVHVVNSPAHCFSISDGPLVVSGVTIDDSQGAYPNAKSNGRPAGHNTDGFDVSGSNIVIKNCHVINQDDCLAINKGENIVFENNYCYGGHGASIGSISSNIVVEGVVFQGNTVVNSVQAFRIKTKNAATNSKVTNVTYSVRRSPYLAWSRAFIVYHQDNTAINCTQYGVIITQSYPTTLGTPGTGVTISDINFSGGSTDVGVVDGAHTIAVNCGAGSCTGIWDWSGLQTSGGSPSTLNNCPSIDGYTL
ncbi:pectin lyase fold/virulence factor [Boletus coccyginus]|nr:pectin lyase fold/virulence factor [Boletus coccyginus]